MYKADLDHDAFADEFATFHALLWGTPVAIAQPSDEVHAITVRPLPARGKVVVEFAVRSAAAGRAWVTDVAGRRVRLLSRDRFEPGRVRMEWDGSDDHGGTIAPGVYFFHLEIGGRVEVHTLIWR